MPFGGGRDEWASIELGAWLAQAHDLPLLLAGADARDGLRDASRVLSTASLALQRLGGIVAETAVVEPGAAGILGLGGAAVVASRGVGPLDPTRREIAEKASCPVIFVQPGLRPSGLVPDRTLTRFSWSLAGR